MLILFISNKSGDMKSMFFSNDFNVDYTGKTIHIFNAEQKLYKHIPFDECGIDKLGNLEVRGDFN